MLHQFVRFHRRAFLVVFATTSACAQSSDIVPADDGGTGEGSAAPEVADAGGNEANGDAGAPLLTQDAGSPFDAGAPGTITLFASTQTSLFRVDPQNVAVQTYVGDFDCPGSGVMTDIAVSKDGKMYGVRMGAAYALTVVGQSVRCDSTWPVASLALVGLTVAPENSLAATETLIASSTNGNLYQIDQVTGMVTQVGTLGAEHGNTIDGDIVFLANNGSPLGFATAFNCKPPTPCADSLLEVDVAAVRPGTQSVLKAVRGRVTKGSWCQNSSSPANFLLLFGLAAYEDKVYGFTNEGLTVEIHNDDATACQVGPKNSSTPWYGAGVSTLAPVVPPPPPR
jgi:hypothetical protein